MEISGDIMENSVDESKEKKYTSLLDDDEFFKEYCEWCSLTEWEFNSEEILEDEYSSIAEQIGKQRDFY